MMCPKTGYLIPLAEQEFAYFVTIHRVDFVLVVWGTAVTPKPEIQNWLRKYAPLATQVLLGVPPYAKCKDSLIPANRLYEWLSHSDTFLSASLNSSDCFKRAVQRHTSALDIAFVNFPFPTLPEDFGSFPQSTFGVIASFMHELIHFSSPFKPPINATYLTPHALESPASMRRLSKSSMKVCDPVPSGRFYSEHEQDRILYRSFFLNRTRGFFVEAGAFDGIGGSNTAFFEQSRCWRGICMEPTRNLFDQLLHNRPSCSSYLGALCKSHGVREFLTVSTLFFNEFEGALSGFTDSMSDTSKQRISKLELNGDIETSKNAVLCYRLTDLLYMHGVSRVDLFSLDVEGAELEVLKGLVSEQSEVPVDLFLIELQHFNEVQTWMRSTGFVFKGAIKYDGVFVSSQRVDWQRTSL